MTISQKNAKKIVKQLAEHAGSIYMLCRKINMPTSTLYVFLNNDNKKLSELSAERLFQYAKKNKINITLKELRPHMLCED